MLYQPYHDATLILQEKRLQQYKLPEHIKVIQGKQFEQELQKWLMSPFAFILAMNSRKLPIILQSLIII
jgi:hypothetical protein